MKKKKKGTLDKLIIAKALLEGLNAPENRDLLNELCFRIGLDDLISEDSENTED